MGRPPRSILLDETLGYAVQLASPSSATGEAVSLICASSAFVKLSGDLDDDSAVACPMVPLPTDPNVFVWTPMEAQQTRLLATSVVIVAARQARSRASIFTTRKTRILLLHLETLLALCHAIVSASLPSPSRLLFWPHFGMRGKPERWGRN